MVTSTGAAPSSGAYSFINLAPGSYVVTPSKTGAVSGITTVDATRILQFLASTLTLTACQQLAADTSQNSVITTTDVTHILNFLASNPPVASNHTGEWRFNPTNHSYVSIITDQTNQNFDAMLLGEVSGNWTPAGPSIDGEKLGGSITPSATIQSPLVPCGAPPIAVTLPTASAGVNLTNFTLPILIGDTTGESVTGYRFTFTFDPAVVGLQATPTDATGTLSSGMSIQTNSSTPGTLIIVAAQASPLTGSGTLLKVNFTRVGAQGATTTLTWTQNFLDDGNNDCVHPSTPVNGAIAIGAAPSASNGIVVGRITSPDGLPVSGAVIRLSGTQNRRTITDSDGNYHFESVETNGFYTVTPSRANYIFSPSQRTFSQLAERTEAAFGANFTGDAANPLDTPEYFVRQQYKDILGREPDEGGLSYWSDRVIDCGSDTRCVSTRRSEVAAAFFIEAEYQQTGSFIYGLYKGALGRRPVYTEFSSDRQQVVAGANLEAARQAFAESFVSRAEFTSRYQQNTTADSFVNALLTNVRQASGVDLDSQRAALINRYNSGSNLNQSRSLVLRDVTDTAGFRQAEYNSAFVLTEYFAYLLRDPDQGGYAFWLDVLNNHEQNNYRSMVCAFVTSREYQERFSRVVTHSNAECGQ